MSIGGRHSSGSLSSTSCCSHHSNRRGGAVEMRWHRDCSRYSRLRAATIERRVPSSCRFVLPHAFFANRANVFGRHSGKSRHAAEVRFPSGPRGRRQARDSPSGTALKPHILTSGTPFMACMNTNPMSKTYPAETATTAVGFARPGRSFSRSISQPAIGKTCNAWIPKKCATLKSPPVVLQLTTGSPGPPGATPTTLCPCAAITPPMTDPARKRRVPNTIPS